MNAPSSKREEAQTAWTRVLALIRPEQYEAVSELFATVNVDLDICTTVDEFIAENSEAQYPVAILPIGMLTADQRALLITALGSMQLRPSIIMYSPQGGSLGWPGWIDSGDLAFVARPFTEDRLRDVIAHAVADFEDRSKRRRC